jgi:hypothetical protein
MLPKLVTEFTICVIVLVEALSKNNSPDAIHNPVIFPVKPLPYPPGNP